MPAKAVVVQALRPAVSGRPEGLHYFRQFFPGSLAGPWEVRLKADTTYKWRLLQELARFARKICKIARFSAGEAGLRGACSCYSDTLLGCGLHRQRTRVGEIPDHGCNFLA